MLSLHPWSVHAPESQGISIHLLSLHIFMLIHLHCLFSLYRLILSLKEEIIPGVVLLILQQWLGSFSVSDLHGIHLGKDKMLNKKCSKNQNKQAAQEDSYNSGVGIC